jgi:pyruvate kinase
MTIARTTKETAEAAPRRRNAAELSEALESLRAEVVEEGSEIFERWRPKLKREWFAPSALNLAYYIALRRHELRDLQLELMPWGLSSLGRCEARVLENLDAVIASLERIDRLVGEPRPLPSRADFFRGHDLLRRQTESALGPTPPNRDVRIMVTMPSEAAQDYELVRDLVQRGMDVARINCAHDGEDAWRAMAEHVRRAVDEARRPCRVCMDICGPRARTGPVVAPDHPRLAVGDRLLMSAGASPPPPVVYPVQFQCSLPEVVEQIEVGQMVWVDEGSLGAIVERKLAEGAVLRVTDARPKGGRVREDKGLNFPDTELRLSPLTPKDLHDLDVIAEAADIVGYSFVQRPSDIELLQGELATRLDRPEGVALVAKIETKLAIANLPELIVQAAGAQPLAVMIARGDLAVEIGYRRMAEIQEELLWLCEAAHVPVIWATQVLDTFVHKGVGARAEITDAAMAERAECVMLNKGLFVAEAVSLLDDMLARMEGHQFKKVSRMRELHSW